MSTQRLLSVASLRWSQPVVEPARKLIGWSGLLGLLLIVAGCQHNPLMGGPGAAWQASAQPQSYQIRDLEHRASQLDSNNRDLHTQLAQSQQQQTLLREQVELLQKRLTETANQLRDTQLAQAEAEKKTEALLASTERRGGALITANNSWRNSLKLATVPGLELRQDADVVRIVLPADQLFQPGTAQLHSGAAALLDKAAAAVASNYPKQLVVVESHTDSAPVEGTGYLSHHQLTAAQAVAIYDQLTRRSQLPARQLSLMAHGSNHPRASNATPAGRTENRRVELVVYPESFQ